MGGRVVTFEQAGGTQEERTRAHGGDEPRPAPLFGQEPEHLTVPHERRLPGPAGNEDDVELRASRERGVRDETELRVGLHGLERLPQQVDLGSGDAMEHLERAREIELRQARIEQHADGKSHGESASDPNAIFVQQGRVSTSAGVTTGIDMALAMVEEDHGRRVADAIAARLVLYARRPGFQSQFSEVLVAQLDASSPMAPLVAWARSNLRGPIDPARLSRRAGMSVRTFHRRCLEQLGKTPAKLIEGLRVEQARTLLTTTSLGTKTIAGRCGFGSSSRMARAFERTLGVAPRDFRLVSGHASG